MPKGKGKCVQPSFFGGKGWGKGGKGFGGKGKGNGKISDVDDAGWAHVGSVAEWNWASGSELAATPTEAAWPTVSHWPIAAAEATAPWMMAAQQTAWPVSAPAWPPAGSAAAPGSIRSMTGPVGGVYS